MKNTKSKMVKLIERDEYLFISQENQLKIKLEPIINLTKTFQHHDQIDSSSTSRLHSRPI